MADRPSPFKSVKKYLLHGSRSFTYADSMHPQPTLLRRLQLGFAIIVVFAVVAGKVLLMVCNDRFGHRRSPGRASRK